MIQQRLQEWIRYPERLDEKSLYELRGLLEQYPYFQTARLLYLKNLFLLQDSGFKEELRKSALYVADLSVLFYFIEGERFVLQKHFPVKQNAEGGQESDRTLDLIDRFLSGLSGSVPVDLPFPAEVNLDYTSVLLAEKQDILSGKPEKEIHPLRGQELIDNFIENEASPGVDENLLGDMQVDDSADTVLQENSGFASEEDAEDADENYFTETLAKIYVKQQRYDKALEIIKKLNLKYPKKNTYFADQIRFLEKLIINAKSK